jgi:hypothetical protein
VLPLHTYYVPVSAHPEQVRPRAIGETRPIEPSELTYWGRLLPIRELGYRMIWPNQFIAKIEDARHLTSLTFPG